MSHIQSLFQYILYAPEEIQRYYCNGYEIGSNEWYQNKVDYAIFKGLLFRNNRVYCINVFIFSNEDDYEPKYLDVTRFFDALCKKYNIYHSALILATCTKWLHRECSLTENLIPFIKYDAPYRLPRLRYAITRNHGKERKFIDSAGHRGRRIWNQTFHKSLAKIKNLATFEEYRTQGPDIFQSVYSATPELCVYQYKAELSNDLPQKRVRKSRRGFNAFNPSKWGSDSGNH